ncbi:MAG TPA: S8 family serine peptidase [Streptosporangiaceae bacterium]|nr:S8 family serine peptidase [Streptosporangiaceae bacterium]
MLGAGRVAVRTLVLVAAGLLVAAVTAGPAGADSVRDQEMWVLDAVHAQQAWQVTQGQGVTVAVIDSGVDPNVSDLRGSVRTGPDLSGVSTALSNANWGVHGTWMASLVAGHGHADGGSSGIIGMAPQAKVLSIRVVTDQSDPQFTKYEREPASRVQQNLATAITYAVRHGAGVISMSLGYGGASQPVRAALQSAVDAGVVVVASAGNSGGTQTSTHQGHAPYSFPADYPGVLGVAAVGQSGAPATFSSDNLSVQVAAPGVRVPAQGRDGKYWLVSGTSPACALTAGVAALVKARFPAMPPALVDDAITASTTHRPPHGYSQRVGFGTVDAAAALAEARRLAHDTPTGRGAGVGSYFGGGPGAVPPAPVAPRSSGALVVYCVLGLVSLSVAWVCGVRLLAVRSRSRWG